MNSIKLYLRKFYNDEVEVSLEELKKELQIANDTAYIVELVNVDSDGNLHFEIGIFGQYN